MPKRVKKALAYVTNRDGEVLVFLHRDFPEAGLQVPAGTVADGEDPNAAVLRETFEESGLKDVRLVGLLGSYDWDARPYRDEIQERYVYHLELDGPAPSEWLHYETDPTGEDEPIAFCFFWMRLDDPTLDLAGGQGDLLDELRRHRLVGD
ncbi:MAG: NUDIX domain-containing protein [Chloroflexi bacterium]|nr:NUDIX domain-containing protein [Chloroflexota bacterium]